MKMTLVMKQWDLFVRLKKVGERVKATFAYAEKTS
jgi:hypothetical protein